MGKRGILFLMEDLHSKKGIKVATNFWKKYTHRRARALTHGIRYSPPPKKNVLE